MGGHALSRTSCHVVITLYKDSQINFILFFVIPMVHLPIERVQKAGPQFYIILCHTDGTFSHRRCFKSRISVLPN
jgi:hypothetical protein